LVIPASVAAVVAFVIALGVTAVPQFRVWLGGAPTPNEARAPAALKARIAGIEDRLGTINSKLGTLAEAATRRPPVPDLSPLAARLDKLEAGLGKLAAPEADLRKLATLEAALAHGQAAQAALETRLATLTSRIETLGRVAGTGSDRSAGAIAILALGQSLAAGAPFVTLVPPTLAALKASGGAGDALAARLGRLRPWAAGGIPTIGALAQSLAALEPTVAAPVTPAPSSSANTPEAAPGLWSQVLARVKGMVKVQRVTAGPAPASSDAATTTKALGTAARALGLGDVAGARGPRRHYDDIA
jgi:hypothetical protein